MRISYRDKTIAKALGVTPIGLAVLGKAVAQGGVCTGSAAGNPGSAKSKLAAQGYLLANEHGGFYQSQITEAGRELVRRAREMGW